MVSRPPHSTDESRQKTTVGVTTSRQDQCQRFRQCHRRWPRQCRSSLSSWCLVLLLICLALPHPSSACQYLSDPDVEPTWDDLAEAVDRAQDFFGALLLCPFEISGDRCSSLQTSAEPGLVIREQPFFLICAGFATPQTGDTCKIDCPHKHFVIESNKWLYLEGFDLEGSERSSVIVGEGATLQAEWVNWRNNGNSQRRSIKGGAIQITGSGHTDLYQCDLEHNQADKGGAIYNEGTLCMTNTDLLNNEAYDGGAIHSVNEIDSVNDGFINNNSVRNGGAVYAKGKVKLRDATFSRNQANRAGGALYVDANVDVEAQNSVWRANKSVREGPAIFHKGTSDQTIVANPTNRACGNQKVGSINGSCDGVEDRHTCHSFHESCTLEPTASPTVSPTSHPSLLPTLSPMDPPQQVEATDQFQAHDAIRNQVQEQVLTESSSSPSQAPSDVPSDVPSNVPSFAFSAFPSASSLPSSSASPSWAPTELPTLAPVESSRLRKRFI